MPPGRGGALPPSVSAIPMPCSGAANSCCTTAHRPARSARRRGRPPAGQPSGSPTCGDVTEDPSGPKTWPTEPGRSWWAIEVTPMDVRARSALRPELGPGPGLSGFPVWFPGIACRRGRLRNADDTGRNSLRSASRRIQRGRKTTGRIVASALGFGVAYYFDAENGALRRKRLQHALRGARPESTSRWRPMSAIRRHLSSGAPGRPDPGRRARSAETARGGRALIAAARGALPSCPSAILAGCPFARRRPEPSGAGSGR